MSLYAVVRNMCCYGSIPFCSPSCVAVLWVLEECCKQTF